MNRTTFTAALAAIFCSALLGLTGCGGGGDSPQTTPVTPPVASSGGNSGVGSGGTGTAGGNNGSNQGNDNQTIPSCTPKTPVLVALQGDDQMTDFYNSGEIQAAMDAHFGVNTVLVEKFTTGPASVNTALYVSADVRVENYGMWDMLAGETIDYYSYGLQNYLHPTLVVTQTPISDPYHDDTPYVEAAKMAAANMGVAIADVNGYVKAQPDWRFMLETDAIRLNLASVHAVAKAVLVPAIQAQVAPLRCLAQ